MRDRCRVWTGIVLLAAFLAPPAYSGDRQFQGEFDPFPHDNSTRDNVVGTGAISATLAGGQLTIRGDFTGLSSPAVAASLRAGAAMGVPGQKIGELAITKADNGQVTGTVRLNAAAIAALNRNALYVEIDSAKAPDGNSWAWLEAPQAGAP